MLREEQIDIRRQRAAEEQFRIQNLGRNRVFSDYQVTNPATGGQYRVSIRGFDVGDNTCACPDFRTNTLGTCKHIEAVLAALRDETPPQLRQPQGRRHPARRSTCTTASSSASASTCRRATPTSSATLADTFFDAQGLWKGGDRYEQLIEAVEQVPEQVTIFSDAMEFIEREIERREMAEREQELARASSSAANCTLDLLKVPLYPYQMRGALFAACRGRCILGDDMGLGKTVQTLAAVELLARERGIERVLVVAPASVKYQWETEIRKFTDRPVQVIEGGTGAAPGAVPPADVLPPHQLRNGRPRPRRAERLAAGPDRARRGPAHQELGVEDVAGRQEAAQPLRPRADRHAAGEQAGRTVQHRAVRGRPPARPGLPVPARPPRPRRRGQALGYRNLDKIREKLEPILLRRTRARC